MGEDRALSARALVGSADIARLAGVRRPAVSNWRRRFDDFPTPVSGSADRPLFALDEVREWCLEHGKDFEADDAELLWQRVRAEVPDLRRTEFLAHVGRLLTEEISQVAAAPTLEQSWQALVDRIMGAGEPSRIYEELVTRWGAERGRAETDPELASWMAELAMIEPHRKVMVPACGGGGLMVEATRYEPSIVFGQDLDREVLAVATARTFSRAKMLFTAPGDALRAPLPAMDHELVDVVLCDPPFRDRDWGHEELAEEPRWVYGLPPRGEGELAWVQHSLARVRPGGRVVVVVPTSVSYRPAGRRIRAGLLRAGALRAILDVPGEREAAAGRQVWVLSRPEEGIVRDGRVLLVGAVERAESLRLYLDFLMGFPVKDEPRAIAVDAGELIDDEVDLRPSRHLALASRGRADVHYTPLLEELDATLSEARALIRGLDFDGGGVSMTTLGALIDEGAVELYRPPMVMSTGEGDLPVLTVADLRAGRPAGERCGPTPGMVTAEPGDVVVAETVRDTPVRVVCEGGEVLGPRLVLLRAVPDRLDPDFLAAAVRPDVVAAGRTASGRADLRSIALPILTVERQREHVRMWDGLRRQRELSERIAELGDRLAELGNRGLREGALRPGKAEP